VVPFAVYAVPQAVGAQHSYVVLSGSMEPTMSPGDVVLVERVDAAAVEPGGIIAFDRQGEPVPTTHRVIGVTERDGTRLFETKGDANDNPDRQPVRPGQLRGRVLSVGGAPVVIPAIGRVIRFADSPLGTAVLLVVPVVLLVASELRTFAAAAREGARPDQGDGAHGTPDGPPGEGRRETSAGADTATASEEETDGGTGTAVTLRADELRIGLVILGLFLCYSGWVAHVTVAFWAFAVAAGVGTGFLLLAAIYVAGRRAQAGADAGTADGTDTAGQQAEGGADD
jgi:signal peptidase